jgi:dihydrofolate synthase/folylpolyglutamate synthase
MDYGDAVEYLDSFRSGGVKPRLEHTGFLLDRLGFDYDGLVVHVAGTNGKGSVSAMIERVLREHGLKTGLYVSPELMDFTDRVFVDGKPIGRQRLASITSEAAEYVSGMESSIGLPTFFELTTAVCLKHLEESGVEVMVLETGMGGRLDSTNAVPGDLAVVTNVDLDHTEFLGSTLAEIAGEKAGILSEDTCMVTAETKPEPLAVLKNACIGKNSRLVQVGVDVKFKDKGMRGYRQFAVVEGRRTYDLSLSLIGPHQAVNAATAVAVLEEFGGLGIEAGVDEIAAGLSKVVWPGRLEVVGERPLVVLDGAHNPSSFDAILKVIHLFEYERLLTVLGFSKTKPYVELTRLISLESDVVYTVKSNDINALDAALISKEAVKYTETETVSSVNAGVEKAF